ncbi:hypothetical protein A0257_21820 [Hymenobacter psoromatis]|nr:hypothetical protein A0257_21820 [Hymenobacter psoromatis]
MVTKLILFSAADVALPLRAMNPIKKRLLLLGLLLFLAWTIPSEPTFYVSYFGSTPATVYIDDEAAFTVTTNWYSNHTARLRPGIHSLTLRRDGTVIRTWFLYLHMNSTAVEYSHFQDKPGLTLDASWHLGRVL